MGHVFSFDTNCIALSAVIMPDDVADEKLKALEALGATVEKVRPASIIDQKQVSHARYDTLSYSCLTTLSHPVRRKYLQLRSRNQSQYSTQNLAKRRALEFGQSEIIQDPTDDIVISTQASPNQLGRAASPSGIELESRPRGFFADQFEVHVLCSCPLPQIVTFKLGL